MDTKTELKDFNELSLETKENWNEKNFNPDSFKVVDKKYEEEEKLLSKIEFENDQDRYVFQNLPLTPVQKLELIYSLIAEESKHVEVDEELKENIQKIMRKEENLKKDEKKTHRSVSD